MTTKVLVVNLGHSATIKVIKQWKHMPVNVTEPIFLKKGKYSKVLVYDGQEILISEVS